MVHRPHSRVCKLSPNLFGHRITSDALGPYGDIRTTKKKVFFTDIPAAIPKHTDQCYRHTPLGINFLQCVKTSGVGGETVLGDAFEIARVLRETDPEAFALLTTVPIQFYRYIEGKAAYYSEACVISLDYLGDVVGFRYSNRQTSAPLELPAELVEPMHDALRKLSALMRHPDFEIRFLLEPGDILAYDNQRVIHGRTHYDDSQGARHLRQGGSQPRRVPQSLTVVDDKIEPPRTAKPRNGSRRTELSRRKRGTT